MKTLCINLDSRPDRWAQASAEFARVGLTVERVSAVSGDNKPLAFNQSVYKCMEMCREDVSGGNITGYGYQDLLLFEDDVVFDCEPFGELGTHFQMSLHFGANIMGQWKMPEATTSPIIALLHNCWQSHATYYSAECVAFILNNLDPTYIDENNCIFDEWFRRNVLPMGRSYVMKPMIAYQRPSFSDIWNTQADYTQCHYDGNKYLATL